MQAPPNPPNPQDHRSADHRALTSEEERVRKRRVLATGLALAGFVLLVFLVSLARLHTNILSGAAA